MEQQSDTNANVSFVGNKVYSCCSVTTILKLCKFCHNWL